MVRKNPFSIGNTPLQFMPEINDAFGLDPGVNVYVKDESVNEVSGTVKDRRNLNLAYSINRNEQFVDITSGNDGYSRGRLFKRMRPDVTVFNIVDQGIDDRILTALERVSIVLQEDLSKEPINLDRYTPKRGDITIDELRWRLTGASYDGSMVEPYRSNGYAEILDEILLELNPTHLIVPVGNGELFSSLCERSYFYQNTISKNLKIIGVTAKNANPFDMIRDNYEQRMFSAYSDGYVTEPFLGSDSPYWNGEDVFLDFKYDPAHVADKLVCPCTPWFDQVITLVSYSDNFKVISQDDSQTRAAYEKCLDLGLTLEPSPAISFAALPDLNLGKRDTVVILNTGRGLYFD